MNKVNLQKALAKYAYCLMNACPLKTCSRNEMRPASFLLYLMVNMFLSLIQQSAHSVVAVSELMKLGILDMWFCHLECHNSTSC